MRSPANGSSTWTEWPAAGLRLEGFKRLMHDRGALFSGNARPGEEHRAKRKSRNVTAFSRRIDTEFCTKIRRDKDKEIGGHSL